MSFTTYQKKKKVLLQANVSNTPNTKKPCTFLKQGGSFLGSENKRKKKAADPLWKKKTSITPKSLAQQKSK